MNPIKDTTQDLILVGWREWVTLPDLGIYKIKAKIDTGAKTSCLHAFEINDYIEDGQPKVRFKIHPLQYSTQEVITCFANVIDYRTVTDSGGHSEKRFVIETSLVMNGLTWPIEMTLTNREDMRFRMLIGRTAMRKRIIVNPSQSFMLGK